MTKETRDGPTPNGGVKSEIYYLDDNMEAVDKEQATQCEIVELDKDDNIIQRTYGRIGR